jgi:hypothetical protein
LATINFVRACTLIVCNLVSTNPVVVARLRGTVVNVDPTQLSSKPFSTSTTEAVVSINTLSSIEADSTDTVVHQLLAPLESLFTS